MKTAQSFFIWIGVLISLIISCVSLLSLWFGLIDVITTGYPEGSGMQTAAAGLIIAFPLYVWLTRIIHSAERTDTASKDIWVRTWVLYGILFISACTIAIDGFILLSSFLSGEELTASFVLKSASAAALLLACFWYYLKEIRHFWAQNKAKSELVGMSVGAAVVFSVVLLFIVAGSPAYLRKVSEDRSTVATLQSMQYQIIDYWQRNGKLPTVISELNDPISGYTVPLDSKSQITYSAVKDKEFELCANFGSTYKKLSSEYVSDPYSTMEYWEHGEGRQCFKRIVDEKKYPVQQKQLVPLLQ